MAGQGDVNSGTCLGTDTAFPWGQETSASDSHMGLSVTVGWEADTAGPSMGGDKEIRSSSKAWLAQCSGTDTEGRGGQGSVRRPRKGRAGAQLRKKDGRRSAAMGEH